MTLVEEVKRYFKEAEQPVLLAGAGVSARAGLPTWGAYLDLLAGFARRDDPLTCDQILESVKAGEFALAASYFFMSRKLRAGDKLEALAKPLDVFDVSKIQCLAGLPFQAYVTTNYDRALLSLYAKATGDAPVTYDLGDPGMAAAIFRDDFFVSRIHGRVETPQTMVLSVEHYKGLRSDRGYQAFLRNLFGFKNVLFLGFSFYDPAIREVLEMVHRDMGPLAKGRHTALMPSDTVNEFSQQLDRLNIRRVNYSPDSNHQELWNAICDAARDLKSRPVAPTEATKQPMAVARRYIAACYARSRLRHGVDALRQSVQEGVICSILNDASGGIDQGAIVEVVRKDLVLSPEDATRLVDETLSRLVREQMCRLEKETGRYFLAGELQKGSLREAVQILVGGVVDRFVVREQGSDNEEVRALVQLFFDDVVVRRGWDLGAAFAAHRVPDALEVERVFWSLKTKLSERVVERLIHSAKSMFFSPTPEESLLLEAIGRAGFALELALQAPRDVLFHGATLPEAIYLDANVLLPALTTGHAFEPVYRDSIQRLRFAGNQASVEIKVLVYEGFLNEVVSHRRIAKEIAREQGDALDDHLARQLRLFGPQGSNVFLGAYANTKIGNPNLSFDAYLAANAPYEDERQLAKWLAAQGIDAIAVKVEELDLAILNRIKHHLNVVFADELSAGRRRHLLIDHDSRQILALIQAQREGRRVLFATADRALRDGLANSPYVSVAQSMVSHVAMAQLIGLLIGPTTNEAARQGLGRMLWTARITSDYEAARNYYVNLAISKFDEAMAMNMGDAVEKTAQEAAYEVKRQGLSFDSVGERSARALRILEQYEDGFFAAIRAQIEKRERQMGERK